MLGELDMSDRDDKWTEAIDAAHPTRTGTHDQWATAMEMVSARHSKGSLVALVHWLLVKEETKRAAAIRECAELAMRRSVETRGDGSYVADVTVAVELQRFANELFAKASKATALDAIAGKEGA